MKHGDGALVPSFLGEHMDKQVIPISSLWGYHCLFPTLSQYFKSFMSVFTEKTIIVKRPPGLSLGEQATKELSKCFCLSEGQGFYGLSSLSPGAHLRARPVANKSLTCLGAPQLEVPYCSHKLAMDNCISASGSRKQCLRIQRGERSVSPRSSAAAHEALP